MRTTARPWVWRSAVGGVVAATLGLRRAERPGRAGAAVCHLAGLRRVAGLDAVLGPPPDRRLERRTAATGLVAAGARAQRPVLVRAADRRRRDVRRREGQRGRGARGVHRASCAGREPLPDTPTNRGFNYWESADRSDRRLIFAVDSFLQQIDARTGEFIRSFGTRRPGRPAGRAAARRRTCRAARRARSSRT